LATARAGNVVGGGDWSEDRLIPDLVRSYAARRPLEVRSPDATRPWQHVLESVSGYMLLAQQLYKGERQLADAWNFGPDHDANRTVAEVLEEMKRDWPELTWNRSDASHPHEAGLLWLDTSKARQQLRWRPVWDFSRTLEKTSAWYRDFYATGKPASRAQLGEYVADAAAAGAIWTKS
jgi:CDP-glucose 4,6-dehydratase